VLKINAREGTQPMEERRFLSDSECVSETIQFGESDWSGTIDTDCTHVRIMSEQSNLDISKVIIGNTLYSNYTPALEPRHYHYNLIDIDQIVPGTFSISYYFNILHMTPFFRTDGTFIHLLKLEIPF